MSNKKYRSKIIQEICEARRQGQYVRSKTWSSNGDKKNKKLSRKRFNSKKSDLSGQDNDSV